MFKISRQRTTNPSDLYDGAYFEGVPREALVAYLQSRGWRMRYRQEKSYGLHAEFWDHPTAPLNPKCPQQALFNTPAEADINEDTGIVVPGKALADYGNIVACILNDLERHEDRWRGAILDDVLAMRP